MLDFSELNTEQLRAVEKIEGPLLILAGAGSGKTKALTYRIANILGQYKALPNEILAVTFTNKAATEIKDRISKLLGKTNSKSDLFYMGTFHSICVKILRKEGSNIGITPNFVIYDTDDSLGVIKEIFNKLNLSPKEVNPKTVQSFISSAKNELITEKEYRTVASGYFQQIVARIYPEYQKELLKSNAVDFDDLIMKTIQLFENHPLILEKYQKQLKYILVDEYQDTNHAQYHLIHLLAKISRNICVVGDEDQSIYKFRGSDIRNILNFEKDYPDALVVKLEQNYRSTKNILDAANSVIKHNTQRRDKKMWTANIDGTKIKLYFAEDEKDEGEYIVKNVQFLLSQNTKIKDAKDWGMQSNQISIGVLYRTNAQSRSLEEAFIKNGIPYKLVGGTKFYERREIKDIIAYLRVIQNPKDNLSLFRIINTPKRQAGKKVMDELQQICDEEKCNFGEFLTSSTTISIANTDLKKTKSPTELKTVTNNISSNVNVVKNPVSKNLVMIFSDLFQKKSELKVKELIRYVIDKVKYLEYLDDGTEDGKSRIENLQELLSVAETYSNFKPEESLSRLLEDLALIEQDNKKNEENKDKGENKSNITLMSVHASKGLEYDAVFIAGMEEGLFPHTRSLTDADELEEERRLAYVALTRARKELHIIYAESRMYFGSKQANLRSRFIDDLPESLTETNIYDNDKVTYTKESWNSNYSKASWNKSKKSDGISREKFVDDWSSWE
jgi:DNA helicase-2/ATP-dependent DNA helicase PcrA